MEMSLASKIFIASAIAWVTGRATNLKIKGTPSEVEVISGALNASRDLFMTIGNPDLTVEEVVVRLNAKSIAAKNFEMTFGVPWPL